ALIGDELPDEPFSLEEQAPSLRERLRFLTTLAELLRASAGRDSVEPKVASSWRQLAGERSRELEALLDRLNDVPLPAPLVSSFESTVEYDRRREIKESLLEDAIAASLAFRQAARAFAGGRVKGQFPWEPAAAELERAIATGATDSVRRALRDRKSVV